MKTIEKNVTIGAKWSNRDINQLVDTLSKKTTSSLYITKDQSRQIAMKSVIGLLSGNFREGDVVKISAMGEDEGKIAKDLKIAEEILLGDYNF